MIKLGEVVMIFDLHRQGLTVSAIARELGLDRKTVRRCIKRGPTTQIERRDDDHEIADPGPFTTTRSLAWVTQSSRGKAPADQCGNPRLFCSRLLRARTTHDRATSTHG